MKEELKQLPLTVFMKSCAQGQEMERTSLVNNNRNNAVLSFYVLPCCSYHSTQSQTTSLTESRANMTLTLLGFNMQSSHKYCRINAVI